MRVSLMLTCLVDLLYPEVGQAVVRVLERAGCEVDFDARQTCCGQPAFNSGDWASARKVARHALSVFSGADIVVVPSGSCAAMVQWGYPQLFEGEPELAEARELGSRTYELAEFLVLKLGKQSWPGAYNRRIAFHRSCHTRELRSVGQAERLLESISGIDLQPFEETEQCCGFGGVFSVTHPFISTQIGEAKIKQLEASGAEEVVSADMGCLMHLGGLLRNRETNLKLKHLAQVLEDAAAG